VDVYGVTDRQTHYCSFFLAFFSYSCHTGDKNQTNRMAQSAYTEVRAQVENILDEVRPVVDAHGGDVSISSLKDGVLYLDLAGACVGCPMAGLTFGMVVENRIKEELGDKIHTVYYNEDVGEAELAAHSK